MMKIAYVSGKMFSDVDISYLSEAQKIMDITYFVPVSRHALKGAAFNLQSFNPKHGIFKAVDIYPELQKYSRLLDSSKFYVVNSKASHMWYPCNLWLYVKFAWMLRKYDVIHLTDFPYYYEWFYYFLRKKIVLTVHDPIPHSSAIHNRTMIMLNRRIGFRLINHFILLNRAQIEECVRNNHLQKKHIYESKLGRYDYLGIYEKKCLSNNRYILFFGQISSYKGLDYLLPAMVELHKSNPGVRLILAGKGKYHFDISDYKQLDYIEFRNCFIPDDELAGLIQNSMFIVCPYIDATQSGVIMSAYAFNKPVVATNVGGLPEMVVNGRHGLIVPPKSAECLVKAMKKLCDDPELLQQYKSNIQADYQTGEKSWKVIARRLSQVYFTIYQNLSS